MSDEFFNERVELEQISRWASEWFGMIRANKERVRAIVRAIRNSSNSTKYFGVKINELSDDDIWSLFKGIVGHALLNINKVGRLEPKAWIKVSFSEEKLVGDAYAIFSPLRGKLFCGGRITINKALWANQNYQFKKRIIVHELGHWWDWMLGCFGAFPNEGGYSSRGGMVYGPVHDNMDLISKIFSDKRILLKIVRDYGDYHACKHFAGEVDYTASMAESYAFIQEFLSGSVFTDKMLQDLKQAKKAVSEFDWKGATCEKISALREQANNLSSQTTGSPFRFGLLIFLNTDENIIDLINGLAHSVTEQVQQQDLGEEDRWSPDDEGMVTASTTNILIKLADTLDSAGLSNIADKVDVIIKASFNYDNDYRI